MFKWNDLRVTLNGNNLVIDVEVANSDYYSNIYIDYIMLDTLDTYSDDGVSSKAVTIFKAEDSENIKLKLVTFDVSALLNNLFFVYIKGKGTLSDGTPCGMKDNVEIGVTWNKQPIYESAMSLIGSMKDNCTPNTYLMDWILRYNAFELCLLCADYTLAALLWKDFFMNVTEVTQSNGCGCYG